MPNFMSVKYLVDWASSDVKWQAEKPPCKLLISKAAVLPPDSIFVLYRSAILEAYIHVFFLHLFLFSGDMKNGQKFIWAQD